MTKPKPLPYERQGEGRGKVIEQLSWRKGGIQEAKCHRGLAHQQGSIDKQKKVVAWDYDQKEKIDWMQKLIKDPKDLDLTRKYIKHCIRLQCLNHIFDATTSFTS